MEKFIAKNYADSYLYHKGEYERHILEFLLHADEIDKHDEQFSEIMRDVKRRQVTNSLINVLDHPNVVLLSSGRPLPKAFKIFSAKDIRNDKELKVFMDISEIIKLNNGVLMCNNVDILIAYLVSAMTHLIYYVDGRRLVNNSNIFNDGMDCFINMMNYVMGYLKLGVYSGHKEKLAIISSIYYQMSIMGRDDQDSILAIASKKIHISQRDTEYIKYAVRWDSDFNNISTFVDCMKRLFKISDLTTEAFTDKWIYVFGPGTQFATELFPAFATMITHAYCGVFLNNQRTIEGQCGNFLVNFTNGIFKVGADSI